MAEKSDFFTHQDCFFGRGPDIDYLRQRVATPGITFLAARPKMGKSWLLLALAQKLSEGDPKAEPPGYLVGYHECRSGEEFLRYTLQDLYTRWLQDASLLQQAKKALDDKKDSWLPAAARVLGAIFGGGLPGGLGDAVKAAIDGLVSANDSLKSGGFELPRLADDQGRDLAVTLKEITGRRLVLIFDAWEKTGSLEKERAFLEIYLAHRDKWPEIHFVVALRYPNLSGTAADSAYLAAQDMAASSARVKIHELPNLYLNDPAESARLTAYLRRCLPNASAVSDAQLLAMLQAYPGTLERWADDPDLATADQLKSAANDAEMFLYRELGEQLGALEKGQTPLAAGQITLALRLALLPRLSAETWPLLKPVIEDGLPPDGWIDICVGGLLTGGLFPTFGHDTRHQAAATWFLKKAATTYEARISKEASRLIIGTGRRMHSVTPALPIFSAAVNGVYQTSRPVALTPLADAFGLANTALRGQNPAAALLFSAKWQGSSENVADLSPILSGGLFNAIIDAQTARDFPLAMGLLEELRRLVKAFPLEQAVRQWFAMILVNSANFARSQGNAELTQSLIDELRGLAQAHPEDASLNPELALALHNAIAAADTPQALAQTVPLLEELRGLPSAGPDIRIVQSLADSLFYAIFNGLRAGRSFEQLEPWLDELRKIASAHANAMVVLCFGDALLHVGFESVKQQAPERTEAIVTELRAVQLRFPADPKLAFVVTRMLCYVIGNTPWPQVFPGRRPLLEQLQGFCAAFPKEAGILERVRSVQDFLRQSCNAAPPEMLAQRTAFLAELQALSV